MTTIFITIINVLFWLFTFYGFSNMIVGLPKKLQLKIFDPDRKFYKVSKKEMEFYRKIKLPKWKDKLPQRRNTDFEKHHLPEVVDEKYLITYIYVTCRAEVIHYAIAAFGFVSLLFSLFEENTKLWFWIYFAISFVMGIGNIPFSMIQRYNRHRLSRLLKKMKNRAHI
ncbi:MAG: hypothetical protein Q4B31_02660 [Clostridia bacterium]|nr:hypothetical protein [Clostridia bacterium]